MKNKDLLTGLITVNVSINCSINALIYDESY